MKVSAFVASSVDGFIARRDGSVDWLDSRGADYGYQSYFDSVDALVIGRRTYQSACQQDPWPYGFKRVLVLSRGYVQIAQPLVRFVESTQYAPGAILDSLRAAGSTHVSIGGAATIQGFIQAGLLNAITITRMPLLLGDGISLFGPATGEVGLQQTGYNTYNETVSQCSYRLNYGGRA